MDISLVQSTPVFPVFLSSPQNKFATSSAISPPANMSGSLTLQLTDFESYAGHFDSLTYDFITNTVHQRNPKGSSLHRTLSGFKFVIIYLLISICSINRWIKIAEDKPMTILNIKGMQYAANDSIFDNGWKYDRMVSTLSYFSR